MKKESVICSEDISVRYISFDGRSESFESDRCHERFEIVYHVKASGSCIVEGTEYDLSSGSIMLVSPFAYHRVEPDNSEFGIFSVLFAKSVLSEKLCVMLETMIGSEESSGVFYSHDTVNPAVHSVFERFFAASELPKNAREEYFTALLSEIILLLSVNQGESIIHQGDSLGARAMRYLNNNIEKNVSLDRLARHFFVSKYHLCRAFKEYSGISVHSYINHKRIMYARRLIESGVTASGAAEKVGFGDYSAFYRAYVKIVGKSPTAD